MIATAESACTSVRFSGFSCSFILAALSSGVILCPPPCAIAVDAVKQKATAKIAITFFIQVYFLFLRYPKAKSFVQPLPIIFGGVVCFVGIPVTASPVKQKAPFPGMETGR
jgi:hypothetical protein